MKRKLSTQRYFDISPFQSTSSVKILNRGKIRDSCHISLVAGQNCGTECNNLGDLQRECDINSGPGRLRVCLNGLLTRKTRMRGSCVVDGWLGGPRKLDRLIVHWTAVCDDRDGVNVGIVGFQPSEGGGALRSERSDVYRVGVHSDGDG